MQLLSTPTLTADLRTLVVETTAPIQLLDVTEAVAATVRAAGLRAGVATVFSRHTTAAVRVQEDEPLLLEDLEAFLRRLAPPRAPYRHNDFQVRTEHMHPDESPNGHSHCLHLLLGSSESIPVRDGALQLGTWQRLFLVELDGPRPRREVLVQTLGLGTPAGAAPLTPLAPGMLDSRHPAPPSTPAGPATPDRARRPGANA